MQKRYFIDVGWLDTHAEAESPTDINWPDTFIYVNYASLSSNILSQTTRQNKQSNALLTSSQGSSVTTGPRALGAYDSADPTHAATARNGWPIIQLVLFVFWSAVYSERGRENSVQTTERRRLASPRCAPPFSVPLCAVPPPLLRYPVASRAPLPALPRPSSASAPSRQPCPAHRHRDSAAGRWQPAGALGAAQLGITTRAAGERRFTDVHR